MSRIKWFLKRKEFTLILMLLIVIVLFTALTGGMFVNPINIRNILNSMVIVSFLTIGEGMLIIYGNIDLSSGTVGTMCSLIMAIFLTDFGFPFWLAVIAAVIAGMIVGVINATLIVKFRFQPFIATLAVSSVAEGLSNILGNASAIEVKNDVLNFIGSHRIFDNMIPIAVLIALVFMAVYGFILAKTKFGRTIYLCGGNREAARLVGINPNRICYILFMNMGALSAISGCLLAFRMKSATVTGIMGNQFSGVTAAILGGISFGGGSGSMLGAFFGLLLLNCFNNGMTLVGLDPYWQTVASGAILLLALIIDYYSTKSKKAGSIAVKMK